MLLLYWSWFSTLVPSPNTRLDIRISDIKSPNIRYIPAVVANPNIQAGHTDIGYKKPDYPVHPLTSSTSILISRLDIRISDKKIPNIRYIPAVVASPNIQAGRPDIGYKTSEYPVQYNCNKERGLITLSSRWWSILVSINWRRIQSFESGFRLKGSGSGT